MAFDIKSTVLGVLLPLVISSLESVTDDGLDQLQVKNPGWHKSIVQVAYVLFKQHGVDLAASTANTYDDKGVAAVVEVLEKNATKHGIVLPS